jgi:hypothetical protein
MTAYLSISVQSIPACSSLPAGFPIIVFKTIRDALVVAQRYPANFIAVCGLMSGAGTGRGTSYYCASESAYAADLNLNRVAYIQ